MHHMWSDRLGYRGSIAVVTVVDIIVIDSVIVAVSVVVCSEQLRHNLLYIR